MDPGQVWSVAVCVLGAGPVDTRLTQTPRHLVAGRGQNASLHCKQDQNHNAMYWYRQDPGQGPRMLFYFYYEKLQENKTDSTRFVPEQPEKSILLLTVRVLAPEDSAVYLCASSKDTALRGQARPVHKPTPSQSRQDGKGLPGAWTPPAPFQRGSGTPTPMEPLTLGSSLFPPAHLRPLPTAPLDALRPGFPASPFIRQFAAPLDEGTVTSPCFLPQRPPLMWGRGRRRRRDTPPRADTPSFHMYNRIHTHPRPPPQLSDPSSRPIGCPHTFHDLSRNGQHSAAIMMMILLFGKCFLWVKHSSKRWGRYRSSGGAYSPRRRGLSQFGSSYVTLGNGGRLEGAGLTTELLVVMIMIIMVFKCLLCATHYAKCWGGYRQIGLETVLNPTWGSQSQSPSYR
uniref:Ig-like domain-containing protein n=1 Tax=Ornithorhynchus anatinus TaxID=9258 RepID=A0A6I8P253_ORNAN